MALFAFFNRTHRRENILLSGERILLRPIGAEDAEAMFVFASDPEVTRYLPWESDTSILAIRTWLTEQVGRRKSGLSLGFAIVHRESGVMIGSTDLMDLKIHRGQAELGYLLARPHWGQGVMTEATRLTIDYGFDDMNLHTIYAWVDQANLASRRVLEKLGMRSEEGEIRFVKGERRPYLRFKIERDDR